MRKVGFLFTIILLLTGVKVLGQQVSIDLGPDQIASNQAFTITLTIHNARLENYSPFPEIPGFVKRGTSSSSSTNFVNGRRSSSQSIIQNYVATAEGEYTIKPFSMEVNGKNYNVQGKKIKVGPPAQRRQRNDPFGTDPFQDLFGRQNAPQEFVDVKADAFLALTTDKSAVYPGEGFTLTLAFYVASNNRADMRFYELSKQIPEIMKKIKPANCWEENFNIDNITGEPVEINGESYTQFKIFQAAYYPLNNETINFPKVGLELIKYKVAKNPTFFGRNKQEEIVTFSTKPKKVTIKDLPPHPLRESVTVGNYRLKEKISSESLKTGESFNYSFDIAGEGNISAIGEPRLTEDDNFDIYSPNIRQDISRGHGKVRGTKSFSYYGIPNEPGEYALGDYLQFIYFNVKSETYDTLKSEIVLNVSGESKKNEYILSNDMGSFYDAMDIQSNQLTALDAQDRMRSMANIAIFVLIGLIALVMFKK
ncbi:Oxygen tolerance [Reichenbachiella faecimaris]|uniref:Oxygen tolerance n=1 Tax=Reichenbachiella faecimaris TaxID=692418 RepID=A0A1W2GEL5_REIFA|nr:BatD family protein [Reichenbachiella faecimaris]SMD35087.1 Oxygen tolerance [Reichenbachiella faecimaris]